MKDDITIGKIEVLQRGVPVFFLNGRDLDSTPGHRGPLVDGREAELLAAACSAHGAMPWLHRRARSFPAWPSHALPARSSTLPATSTLAALDLELHLRTHRSVDGSVHVPLLHKVALRTPSHALT